MWCRCGRLAERIGNAWKVESLKVIPFFTDLAPATLRRIAPLFSTKIIKRGDAMIREGEVGSHLYVLVQAFQQGQNGRLGGAIAGQHGLLRLHLKA